MLYWIVKNKKKITAFSLVVATLVILISVWVFDNSYYNTGWHWGAAFAAATIYFFVNFCIIEERVIELHRQKQQDKEHEKEKQKAHRPDRAHRPQENKDKN